MTKQDKPAAFIHEGYNLYVLHPVILTNTQMAKDLSVIHTWEDVPTIKVRWEPGSHYYPTTPETIHKYHVYVDGITGHCDWEITGETMAELGIKLAHGLEELAEYLENASKFLHSKASRRRLEAEHEARKAERRG